MTGRSRKESIDDNSHDDSSAGPFPHRRDTNPDFSKVTELYRCDLLNRRRDRRFASLVLLFFFSHGRLHQPAQGMAALAPDS